MTPKNVTGKVAAKALDAAGMNQLNSIPFDPRKPFDPSGVRLGTPSVTSRGMREPEMVQIAKWMDAVVNAPTDAGLHEKIAGEVRELCAKFPAPGILL
jgi:glycine hydroxymethyltransferase